MKTKYFVYARKSTEDEERQVMSIEAQLEEINEFARREGVRIAQIFIESKSAKKPGRPVFNQMVGKIYESKEPVGILAWHPDRLARNSVDGGQIIYLIDIRKIVSLKFPTFWFEPTPQGLFMLQVAFGQSKYYSDNLSENVKRGIRQKIRRGEWATLAPLGYVNNPKTRNIEPDNVKARILQRGFEEFADGKHSLETLRHRLYFLGLASKAGRPLAKGVVQGILTNPVYIGLIPHKGELHEGKFQPIVRKELWDRVQMELKRRSRPRKKKEGHNFPFTGLFRCGECGCMITAQYAKKGKYIYYRCSKKNGKCSQSYINSTDMVKQLKSNLERVALPADWAVILLAEIDRMEKEDVREQRSFCQNIENQIKALDEKLDKLVNSFLDGLIEKNIYIKKKDELLKMKVDLQERLKYFGKKGDAWVELTREWVELARQAGKLALSNDFFEIKQIVKKIGSNRSVLDKKVLMDVVPPFDLPAEAKAQAGLVSGYHMGRGLWTDSAETCRGTKEKDEPEKDQLVLICRKLLNEVRTFYQQNIDKRL